MSIKIGVSGKQGSFSEEAAVYYCGKNNITDYELEYLNISTVLKNLEKGAIDKGIFPIENSNGGIVYEAVYAMAKYSFSIEKLFEIDVKHNLMALPGTNPSGIKKIASHPQALKQCRMYLKRKWTDAELIEWEDTAKAAKDLQEGLLSPDTAVIGSTRAAKIYKVEILEENIQDLKFNFTTFLAVSSPNNKELFDDIESLRGEIDCVDKRIFALLKRRFKIVEKIGEYKKENNLPIRDEKRELEIIDKKIKEIKIDKEFVENFYKLLFSKSYKLEE